MHTFDYVPNCNIAVLYAGRNDLQKIPVLSDLWVLKLSNLEWMEAKVGGRHLPIPRFNHASHVHETELVICGGQSKDFSYLKDFITIELNQ